MPSSHDPDPIEWFRYPFIATHDLARSWLLTEGLLGLAPNTLDAYARGLNDFLGFCRLCCKNDEAGEMDEERFPWFSYAATPNSLAISAT